MKHKESEYYKELKLTWRRDCWCKRCKKRKDMAKGYTICWNCLIELDINNKNYKKWKND